MSAGDQEQAVITIDIVEPTTTATTTTTTTTTTATTEEIIYEPVQVLESNGVEKEKEKEREDEDIYEYLKNQRSLDDYIKEKKEVRV